VYKLKQRLRLYWRGT